MTPTPLSREEHKSKNIDTDSARSYKEYPRKVVGLFPAFEIAVWNTATAEVTQKTKDKRLDKARREAFDLAQKLIDDTLKAFADEVRDEVIGEDWGTEGLAGDSDLYMKRMCVNGRLYEQRKSLNNLIDKWIGGEDENLGD